MISTHILDLEKGMPASHVEVHLCKKNNDVFEVLEKNKTNDDGRISFNCPKEKGIYQLVFFTEEYFKASKKEFFFLQTPISFKVEDTTRSYHVPLLLNSYGYSTYRGS